VEGESAAAFIKMTKEKLEDSKLDILTGKVLDGEVLTTKDDIENYIWEFDTKVKLTFTVKDGKLNITEYEKNYTSWGFKAPTKEVCHVENAVVRSYDEYEHNALVRISEYRANGVIEKTDYYSEGKITSTSEYDENGNVTSEKETVDQSEPDDKNDNGDKVISGDKIITGENELSGNKVVIGEKDFAGDEEFSSNKITSTKQKD